MKRNEFIRYCFAGVSAALMPKLLFAGKARSLPNVLILGDSISIGYTPFVKQLLEGQAHVFRPEYDNGNAENCSGTTKGITEIERWIGNTKWDVIHFNFGLHDLKHVDPETGDGSSDPDDPYQADLKQYKKNLKMIARKLKLTGARLIFATTTPVPNKNVKPLREPETVVKYNKSAVKIMKRDGIEVNDLYAFVMPMLDQIQRPDNVHFTKEGYKLMAGEIAEKIKTSL